jgi:hypothetical protein
MNYNGVMAGSKSWTLSTQLDSISFTLFCDKMDHIKSLEIKTFLKMQKIEKNLHS